MGSVNRDRVKSIIRRVLPKAVRRKILRYSRWPPVGRISFDGLRRVTPISGAWGADRGQPIDRYYIERFLATHTLDIQGHVLEFKDSVYTVRFGGNRVVKSDVLHRDEGNPRATIVADLVSAERIPSDTFDCIICTQTLHFVFEVQAATRTLHRILKPGGVLLATVPGISQLAHPAAGESWSDFWRFTQHSVRCLFEHVFSPTSITVKTWGNVLTAVAFLHGLAAEELTQDELDYVDTDYPLLTEVRAVKASQDARR